MSHRYRNLFILAFGVFAVVNTEMGIVGILPEIATAAGNSISQVGYLIGIFALTVTFVGPFFTFFILRFMEQKNAFLLAQTLLSITNIIFILFPYYPLLILARILGGLGHPLFFTLALSYVPRFLPPEKRPLGISIIFSGINVAFVLGFPIISFLTSIFSYKIGMGFSLLANILSLLGIYFFIPKNSDKQEKPSPISISSYKDPDFFFTLPIMTLLFMGVIIMFGYFSPYLREIWHFNSTMVTKSLIDFGIFGFIGNILFGFIRASKATIVFFIGVILLGIVYFSLIPSSYSLSIFILIALWGFLQSGIMLLGQVWFTLNRKAGPEAVNSLLVSSSNLGVTLGTFLGGMLISHIGIFTLPWGGILLFVGVMIGIVLESLYKNRIQKRA